MVQILKGHVSPETAYVVSSYPYGFRLRCSIRYWIEYHPRHGFRMGSQTTNPKRPGEPWNKPRYSTYARFGGCLFLDDDFHVQWTGLTEYSTGEEARCWSDDWRAGVPEAGLKTLDSWVAAKTVYDGARKFDDPLGVGVEQAQRAWLREQRKADADHVDGYDRDDTGESPDF